jgi:Transposase
MSAMTHRAAVWATIQVGRLVRPVSQIAAKIGASWNTIMTAVGDYGRPLIDDPARIATVNQLGVDATQGLLNAVLVADPMHVVMAANRCPDKIRRRVQNEELLHRGRSSEPLYAARKLLLTAAERLSPRLAKRLDVMLAFGDPNGQVYEAWMTKELVRYPYTLWANLPMRRVGSIH